MYSGKIPDDVIITENDIKYHVNIKSGQKTGFFFDQRDNRKLLHKYCKDKKVLDCFTHTGSFGLNALKAGAKEVIFVDSSRPSLEIASKNYELTGIVSIYIAEQKYISYCKSPIDQSWYRYNDVNVDLISLNDIFNDFNNKKTVPCILYYTKTGN